MLGFYLRLGFVRIGTIKGICMRVNVYPKLFNSILRASISPFPVQSL